MFKELEELVKNAVFQATADARLAQLELLGQQRVPLIQQKDLRRELRLTSPEIKLLEEEHGLERLHIGGGSKVYYLVDDVVRAFKNQRRTA